MSLGPALKPQLEHHPADLARTKRLPDGATSRPPPTPWSDPYGRPLSGPVKVGGRDARPLFGDQAGERTRRQPDEAPHPGTYTGIVYAWMQRQDGPRTSEQMRAAIGAKAASMAAQVTFQGWLQSRTWKQPGERPQTEYLRRGAIWPPLPDGATLVRTRGKAT